MENNGISREEHNEFVRRMDEAKERQDARLKNLEATVAQIHALTASVEKLATGIDAMAKEQDRQGKRLETIEKRDGEMWRKSVINIVAAVVGALVGFIIAQFGT